MRRNIFVATLFYLPMPVHSCTMMTLSCMIDRETFYRVYH